MKFIKAIFWILEFTITSLGYLIIDSIIIIYTLFKQKVTKIYYFLLHLYILCSKFIYFILKIFKKFINYFYLGLRLFLNKLKLLKINFLKKKSLIYFIFGVIFAIVVIFIPIEIYGWFKQLPKPEMLLLQGNNKSTKILDKNGNLLYDIYVDKKYSPVKLSQIPDYVKWATISVEDSEFYKHNGIRPKRILKALYMSVFEGKPQGASTITQQLVKNVLLSFERTISRKIKEVIITAMVEVKYSKDQILELYLNNISYGGVAWGIQSASLKYFGINVWELDLAQASMLAGLPSSPSIYSPLVNFELAKQRQLHVLNRMLLLGYIDQEQLEFAYSKELVFSPQVDYIKAPHFVHYVKAKLEEVYGKRLVEYGGLTVFTTLDLNLQQKVESIVKNQIEINQYLNLSNGAVVVFDPVKSSVLAYVGSVDYFKPNWGAVDVIQSKRQPGSTIKPVTYALALKNNYTPATILYDTKISIPLVGSKNYEPVNYDLKFRGPVTLRSSLANSYNIPAVKLANTFGPSQIVSLSNDMGLKDWSINDSFGLSVTLGAKEVRLFELANLYSTFAKEGEYKIVSPFLSIKDSVGNEIYQDNRSLKRVLSKEVSYLIYDILSDNNARVNAFGINNKLKIGNHKVAVKTGTTDNKRDNWALGYTKNFVVGVWVGNNDNSPMNNYLASGLTGASLIWNEAFTYLLDNYENQEISMPDGVFELYSKECNKKEIFIKGTKIPNTLCLVNKDKKTN